MQVQVEMGSTTVDKQVWRYQLKGKKKLRSSWEGKARKIEEEHQEEGPSSQKPELAGKGKEKPGKKTTQTKEPVEEGPVVQKPIKIKVQRPEPEPEDFV